MQKSVQAVKVTRFFMYKEDRWPVFIILMLSLVDFVLYFTLSSSVWLFAQWIVSLSTQITPKAKSNYRPSTHD